MRNLMVVIVVSSALAACDYLEPVRFAPDEESMVPDGGPTMQEGNTDANCADNGQCANGVACLRYTDCLSRICDMAVCAAPLVVTPDAGPADAGPVDGGADGGSFASCTDLVKNQTESDTDCGGTCNQCADGRSCVASTDCVSGRCAAGVCEVVINPPTPTCSDGARNGNETDVDCGGTCNSCANGKMCVASSDCTSGRCNAGICEASQTGGTTVVVTSSVTTSGNFAIVSWMVAGVAGPASKVTISWGASPDHMNSVETPEAAMSGKHTFSIGNSDPQYYRVSVFAEGKSYSSEGTFKLGTNPAPPAPLSDQMRTGGATCNLAQECASKVCSNHSCAPIDPSQSPGPGLVSIRCINQSDSTCVVRGFNKAFNGICEQYRDNLGNCAEGRWLYGVEQAVVIVRLRSVFCSMSLQDGPLGVLVSFTARSNGDWSSSYAEVVLEDGSKVWQDSGHLRVILREHLCPGQIPR